MGDWVATWDRCFVEGCFTYDLAVQIVGTLGALAVALALYRITRRSEEADAKEDRAEQWRIFNAQAALTQTQFDHNLAESSRMMQRWHSEQRTHAMERELEQATQHLKTANLVRMELQKMFAVSQGKAIRSNTLDPMGVARLDTLTGAYSLLPGVGSVQTIRAAHEMAHVMADPPGASQRSRALYASMLDSAISTVASLEKALIESIDMLNVGLREEAGLRVEIIAELAEFGHFSSAHEEDPEE